jgi:hypothetical protein
MSELEIPPAAASVAGLTQMQRVTNTFVAPSKTFDDIQRGNRSWWLPLIIAVLASYILFGAITQKIGIQQTVDNQIRMNPKAQEKLSELTPDQRAMQTKVSVISTEVIFLAGPVFSVIAAALASLVLLGTINFIFGGKAKFSAVMAVWFYSWLPGVIKVLLGVIVIYAGEAPESFNIKNFAPTNAGAFLDPVETNKALYALATSLDAVTIWMLVLLSIGIATVAGVKRSSGYIAVFGWWAIITLVGVGWAAIMG